MKKDIKVDDIIRAVGGMTVSTQGRCLNHDDALYLTSSQKLKVIEVRFKNQLHVEVQDDSPKSRFLGIKIRGLKGFISSRQVTHRIRKKVP